MGRKVIWTISAYHDLQNIVNFIAQDSPYYAMSLNEAVMAKAETIMEFPYRGRLVPELDNSNIREIFMHKYRLMYEVTESSVVIIAIVHGAKDFNGF